MPDVTIKARKCIRCSHIWVSRKSTEPTVCPKCKSPYWNIPKKKK